MKRIIEKDLKIWKESSYRKPLIVRGARQVGKTYSIKKFGKDSFENTVLIDFEKDPSLKKVFEGELSPERVIRDIEVATNYRITPGKTLLFFDEIQTCPRAVLSLRYFYEELPELHVISAGSLLELVLGDVSFPVGRVEFLWMRPMSFKEYLEALGFERLAEELPVFGEEYEISDFHHSKYLDHLKNYFFIGGMPEPILRYLQSKSFLEVKKSHEALMDTYMQSFHQYSTKVDKEAISRLLRQIPQQIGKQIKYTRLDPDSRIERTKSTLHLLEKSLLIQIIRNSNASQLPLGASASDKVFKALFLDIGLMQHLCGVEPVYLSQEVDLMSPFQGALAEQFIGQELLVHRNGSEQGKLYYWSRAKKSSNAEIDYLISREGKIVPIEVKNAPAGRLRSLHLYLQEHPNTPYGIVLSTANHETKSMGNLLFFPLYTIL
jgi:predicted AAA+ superfamily ATPase